MNLIVNLFGYRFVTNINIPPSQYVFLAWYLVTHN